MTNKYMKTLKESLLGNTEDALAAGDDMTAQVEEQFKNLSSAATNKIFYNKYNNGWTNKKYSFFWSSEYNEFNKLFEFLGYDCNAQFSICIVEPDFIDINRNKWTIIVKMVSYTNAGAESTFLYQIEVPQVKTLVSAISKYIKPVFKNINTFKKFLNDLEKNGTPAK